MDETACLTRNPNGMTALLRSAPSARNAGKSQWDVSVLAKKDPSKKTSLQYSLDKLLEAQRQAASGDYSEALKAVRVAGLNCYPFSEEADDVTTFAQR